MPQGPPPPSFHWGEVGGVNYLTQAKNQHIPQVYLALTLSWWTWCERERWWFVIAVLRLVLGPGSHLLPLRPDQDCEESRLAGYQYCSTGPHPPTQLSWQFWQCQVCRYHWLAGPTAPKMILLVWDRAYIVSGVWWVGQSPNELLQNWQSHELRRTITRHRSSLLLIKIRLMYES